MFAWFPVLVLLQPQTGSMQASESHVESLGCFGENGNPDLPSGRYELAFMRAQWIRKLGIAVQTVPYLIHASTHLLQTLWGDQRDLRCRPDPEPGFHWLAIYTRIN